MAVTSASFADGMLATIFCALSASILACFAASETAFCSAVSADAIFVISPDVKASFKPLTAVSIAEPGVAKADTASVTSFFLTAAITLAS